MATGNKFNLSGLPYFKQYCVISQHVYDVSYKEVQELSYVYLSVQTEKHRLNATRCQ